MDVVDFIGIGAQKAGTTWIYSQLSKHSAVTFPRGKETHYWNGLGEKSADEWVQLLKPPSQPACDQQRRIAGEITPAYALLSIEQIAAIRRRCPEIRIFMSLRNPVERAWSAALMALARAEMRYEEASDQWFIDHFHSAASLARGDYLTSLKRWWSLFPREQLLIIFHDDILSHPYEVLSSLATHVGIKAEEFAALPQPKGIEIVRPFLGLDVVESYVNPPLRPSLHKPLRDIYAWQIVSLEDSLERDLSAWRHNHKNTVPTESPPNLELSRTVHVEEKLQYNNKLIY